MQSSSDIRLSVVIPAFNEESRLPRTIEHVLRYLGERDYASEVIVVDDGSTDGTAGIVEQWPSNAVPLRLVRQPGGRNCGKGAAVRHGLAEARGDYRLFMDADNSTTVDHVEVFWPHFADGCDVVIGSRDIRGANVVIHQPWFKELGGKLGNLFIRMLAVPGIHDTQAGFKMFTRRCLDDVLPRLTIDRWGFDVELLAVARHRGYRIAEVPITWINNASSKVPPFAYVQVLGEVWRVRRQRRAGRYD